HIQIGRTTRHSADGRRPVANVADVRAERVRQIRALDRGDHSGVAMPEAPVDHVPVVSLEAVELTVLSCWAEAVAEALAASPDQLNTILDDARAGAPWRRQLGVAEPSADLASALEDLAGMVVSDTPTVEAVLAQIDERPRGGDYRRLVRAVLRSKLVPRRPGACAGTGARWALARPSPRILEGAVGPPDRLRSTGGGRDAFDEQQTHPDSAATGPFVRCTNEAGFGYSVNVGSSPPNLKAAQIHGGKGVEEVAEADGLPGWNGEEALTPVQRYAEMLSGTGLSSADGIEWYFPERLTIDTGAVANGNENAAQSVLNVHSTQGSDLPQSLRIYAFATELGKQGVLTAAETLAKQSGIPSSNLTLINEETAYAHNDPAGASPNNEFFNQLVPFLEGIGKKRDPQEQRSAEGDRGSSTGTSPARRVPRCSRGRNPRLPRARQAQPRPPTAPRARIACVAPSPRPSAEAPTLRSLSARM